MQELDISVKYDLAICPLELPRTR